MQYNPDHLLVLLLRLRFCALSTRHMIAERKSRRRTVVHSTVRKVILSGESWTTHLIHVIFWLSIRLGEAWYQSSRASEELAWRGDPDAWESARIAEIGRQYDKLTGLRPFAFVLCSSLACCANISSWFVLSMRPGITAP